MAACDGISLGDAADVELHPRLRELHGPAVGVEHQLVGPDEGAGLGDLPGIGQLSVPASPAPEPADRCDRDVEDAAGLLVELLGDPQHVEEVAPTRERARRPPSG